MNNSLAISRELKRMADPKRAEVLSRFFKTGPGEYGHGDIFYGITVPQVRLVARKYATIEINEALRLLYSPVHEERLASLLILVEKFRKGDAKAKKQIYETYLRNASRVNNWDLVDLSAGHIVGAFLDGKPKTVLIKLAHSDNLWERRIAIISTFYFIRKGDSTETFKIAELLLQDKHDLIHKAVGWMLREVGKYCSQNELETFLRKNCKKMPRTTLRYAIERFPEKKRKVFLECKSLEMHLK